MDPSREMQLRRALHERGDEYIGRFEELKYLMAPYVATNAAEQRRFYALWDDYVADLNVRTKAGSTESGNGEQKPTPRWKNILWGLVVAILVFAIGMIGYYTWVLIQNGLIGEKPPVVRVDASQEAEVRAGQPLQVFNQTLLERPQDSVGFRWEITDAEGGEMLYQRDSFELDYLVPADFTGRKLRLILRNDTVNSILGQGADTLALTVLCASPPLLLRGEVDNEPVVLGDRRTFSIEAEPDIDYLWIIDSDTLAGAQVQYEFLTEGQSKVQTIARSTENGDYCFTISRPQTIQVGSNLPEIPSIALKRDVPRQLLNVSGWLYWLPLLLGLLLYGQHYRRWKKHRASTREKTDEELAEEYAFHDVGPYMIPYQDQSGQISVPADFYRIADQLRIREEGVRMTFDGRATVEATIREGGFPAWRERAVKRPATYLVLLQHVDESQQQECLLKRLTDFLVAREAALEVYYHGGEFGWFWNEAHPKGWSATQLQSRYGEHRLIVLGDGHGLTDDLHRGNPRLSPAKERWLHGWARRLVLTTEPVTDWSYQEVLLHEHLLLFPATTDGILRGVADLNQVEEYQAGSYKRWKSERLRRDSEPSYRYRTWDDVADHQEYLADDPDLFRWLTALAVAPHPDWSLTIAIGRALGLEVTHDRLLRLSRIPWLAANAPDQDLRLEFLALLDPNDEQLARAAVVEQLELVSTEVAGTFAESEWTSTQAVQAFAIAPKDAAAQGKIKELQRVGLLAPDQLEELNLVASREFEQTKAGYQASEDGETVYLERLLNPPDKLEPRFTRKDKELLGIIFACLLMILPLYLYDKAHNELASGDTPSWWQKVVNPTDDEQRAIEANNVSVLMSENIASSKNYSDYNTRRDNWEDRMFSKLDSALTLKDNYYLADSNKISAQLNREAYRLNWLVKDSLRLLPLDQANLEIELSTFHQTVANTYGDSSSFALQALHGLGLYYWWNYQQGSVDVDNDTIARQRLAVARKIEKRIDSLDAGFFINLNQSMPIHLRYLLAKEPQPFVDFIDRVYSGRVVDQKGNPISGVDVVVAGTQRGVLTARSGNFRINPQVAEGRLLFSYQNGPLKEVSLLNDERRPLENTELGDIVVTRLAAPNPPVEPPAQTTEQQTVGEPEEPAPTSGTLEEDENEALLGRFIDNFSDSRYASVLSYEGTLAENSRFVNQLIDKLTIRRFVNRLIEGKDLADATPGAEYGPIGFNREDSTGTFLFVEPMLSPGPIGDKVDILHRGSRALVINNHFFQEGMSAEVSGDYVTASDGASRFAKVLEANGFTVDLLTRPTSESVLTSMNRLVDADYSPSDQVLLYLAGYHDGERMPFDPANGEPSTTFLSDEFMENWIEQASQKIPHLLLIGNITDEPTFTPTSGENVLPDMVRVAGGSFEMGDTFGDSEGFDFLTNEKPVNTVTVSPFEMGRYEVTFAEYDRFTEATGKASAKAEFGRGQQPVVYVSWFDAISYCNWLSERAGYRHAYALANRKKQSQWKAENYGLELTAKDKVVIDRTANGYRLPTEAEWEFAASFVDGKRKARFGNGRDTLRPGQANFDASEAYKERYSEPGGHRSKTVAVGSLYSPNSLGIHDLAGNVKEWCYDWYAIEHYQNLGNTSRNPEGPKSGTYKVLRGGSWRNTPIHNRATRRTENRPVNRTRESGFRLARNSR